MRTRVLAIGVVFLVLAALSALPTGPSAVRAESYTPAPNTRQLKACVLIMESTGLENPDPYVFHILNQADLSPFKPRGWEIVNPLAPRRLDPRTVSRWMTIDAAMAARASAGTPPFYKVDDLVTPDMAAYWEERLSELTLEDLLKYDVIFITAHSPFKFSPEEREKLRKLVDMGGTVWIEDCAGGGVSANGPFFIQEMNFLGTTTGPATGGNGLIVDPLHPILTTPYRLTADEVNRLGDKNVGDYSVTNLAKNGVPDPMLAPVVMNLDVSRPYIAAGHYGDGTIVATAGDTGCDINDRFTGAPAASPNGGNSGAYCGTPPVAGMTTSDEDAKFVYNVMNWAASESNDRKGTRRTGYTREEVTPSLDTAFKLALPPGISLSAPPIIWRDFVYFGDTNGNIYCLDARAYDDRDGDGDANDGAPNGLNGKPDLTPETPYDVVWSFPAGGAPSAMFAATVVIGGAPVDAVFCTTSDGKLHALRALPTQPDPLDSTRQLLLGGTAELPGYPVALATLAAGDALSTPVVGRGPTAPPAAGARGPSVYVVSREAGHYYLHVRDAASGVTAFPWDTSDTMHRIPLGDVPVAGDASPLSPVCLGNVKLDTSGATADVAYVTLPTGELVATPLHVFSERADPLDTASQPAPAPLDTDADPTIFSLMHGWVVNSAIAEQYSVASKSVTPLAPPAVGPQPYQVQIGAALPAGTRLLVSYDVNPFEPIIGTWLPYVRTPGYENGGLPLSGAAMGADDTLYYGSGKGIVQAVSVAGRGDGASLNSRNSVDWRYNVNNYTYAAAGQPYTRTTAAPWVAARYANGAWQPLQPAVTDTMVYVAMNQYDPTTTPPTPIQGAVFAFDRKAKFYIDLTQLDAATQQAILDAQNLQPSALALWQYSPEADTPDWKILHDTVRDPKWNDPANRNPRSRFWRLDTKRMRIVFDRNDGDTTDYFGPDLAFCPTLPVWMEFNGTLGPALQLPPLQTETGRPLLVWQYPDPYVAADPILAAGWTKTTPRALIREITSAPTISGGVVYVGTGDGRLFALNADPRITGASGRDTNGALQAYYAITDKGLNDVDNGFLARSFPNPFPQGSMQRVPPDVAWIWPALDPQAVPAATLPPDVPGGISATSSVVAFPANQVDANGNRFSTLVGLLRPQYTVGDNNRMMVVDGDSKVQWLMHEANGTNGQLALNHPQSAMQVENGRSLFTDTGNDRVVVLDPDGVIRWEASEVYDPYAVLPYSETQPQAPRVPGRCTRLRTPTDAVQWLSPDIDATGKADLTVTVRHTLIADAGNCRVIEVVDKFAANDPKQTPIAMPAPWAGYRWQNIVVWASQTNASHRDLGGVPRPGQRYRFTSAQPVELQTVLDQNNRQYSTYTRRALCTVSNAALSRVNGRRVQRPGASIVLLGSDPAMSATVNQDVRRGRAYLIDDLNEVGYTSVIGDTGLGARFLDRPASVRRYRFSATELHDLYVDASGIYEWKVPAANANKLPALVDLPLASGETVKAVDPANLYSQFLRETYESVFGGDPRSFQPGSVSVSPAGGWIVTNRVLDRKLAANLSAQQRPLDTRRIQVFRVDSVPAPLGHYALTPGDATMGYTPSAITWLCGPCLLDQGGRNLSLDLQNPMYAVRAR